MWFKQSNYGPYTERYPHMFSDGDALYVYTKVGSYLFSFEEKVKSHSLDLQTLTKSILPKEKTLKKQTEEQNEQAQGERFIEVHDVLILTTPRRKRVWLVTGSLLGSLEQESLFQLRPLDEKVGCNADGKHHEALVPMEIMFALKNTGNLEIIHRP